MMYKKISMEKMSRLIREKKTTIIDVRGLADFRRGHIPNAIHIQSTDIYYTTNLPTDKNSSIIVYCAKGYKSSGFCQILCQMGYLNVNDMGGLCNWTGALISD